MQVIFSQKPKDMRLLWRKTAAIWIVFVKLAKLKL